MDQTRAQKKKEMTLPYEEQNSINYTRDFLWALLSPKKTPKVPKVVRNHALRLLRHYPAFYRVAYYFDAERTLAKQNGTPKQDLDIQYGKK